MDQQCLAYIDPGTGTILIQFLIGACVGAGLFFRRTIARLTGLFTRSDAASTAQTPPSADESVAG